MDIDLTQLSEGEISWLEDKGIISTVKPPVISTEGKRIDKILCIQTSCNLCSNVELIWKVIKNGKGSSITPEESNVSKYKTFKRDEAKATVFICSNCRPFLMEKSKENLVDIILLKRGGLINEGGIYDTDKGTKGED